MVDRFLFIQVPEEDQSQSWGQSPAADQCIQHRTTGSRAKNRGYKKTERRIVRIPQPPAPVPRSLLDGQIWLTIPRLLLTPLQRGRAVVLTFPSCAQTGYRLGARRADRQIGRSPAYSMTWAEKPTKKNSVGAESVSRRLSSTDRPRATAVERDRYR